MENERPKAFRRITQRSRLGNPFPALRKVNVEDGSSAGIPASERQGVSSGTAGLAADFAADDLERWEQGQRDRGYRGEGVSDARRRVQQDEVTLREPQRRAEALLGQADLLQFHLITSRELLSPQDVRRAVEGARSEVRFLQQADQNLSQWQSVGTASDNRVFSSADAQECSRQLDAIGAYLHEIKSERPPAEVRDAITKVRHHADRAQGRASEAWVRGAPSLLSRFHAVGSDTFHSGDRKGMSEALDELERVMKATRQSLRSVASRDDRRRFRAWAKDSEGQCRALRKKVGKHSDGDRVTGRPGLVSGEELVALQGMYREFGKSLAMGPMR